MSVESELPDYYELLQISPNAEPETVHRVYRLLAQRYHPDNGQSGDDTRFRELVEAYNILGAPENRAKYDVAYAEHRKARWQPTTGPERVDNPIEVEQMVRLTVLEVLYERRRTNPQHAGVFVLDIEDLTGQPREHLEFTTWYLVKKGFVAREENAALSITADGVDYLENIYRTVGPRRRISQKAGQTNE